MTSFSKDDRENAALWQLLHLSLDEAEDEAHESHARVVLYGRPGSGKRTICQRLCAAALYERDGNGVRMRRLPPSPVPPSSVGHEASYSALVVGQKTVPLARLDDVGAAVALGEVRGATGAAAAAAALQGVSGSDVCDTSMRGEDNTAAPLLPPPSAGFATRPGESWQHALPRGAGVAYASVANDASTQTPAVASSSSASLLLHHGVDFFCCDTPGALYLALPTPASLQEAIVLLVVDVSRPEEVRGELRALYASLQEHARCILSEHAPAHDEIARLTMSERREAIWLAEESRLSVLRPALQRTAHAEFQRAMDMTPQRSNAEQQNVKLTLADKAMLCPVQSVVVASKIDLLTRRSTAVAAEAREMMTRTSRTAQSALPVGPFYASVRRCQMSVFDYVMQGIRLECIQRRSALVTVGCDVQTTATTAIDGGRCTLVHPFYRALWSYVVRLLQLVSTDSKVAPSPAAEADGKVAAPRRVTVWEGGAEDASWVRLLPAGVVPLGVDSPSLLDSYIVYSATLHDHAADGESSSLRCDDKGVDEDGARAVVHGMHEGFLQQVIAHSKAQQATRLQSEAPMPSPVTSPRADLRLPSTAPEPDDELIWEAL